MLHFSIRTSYHKIIRFNEAQFLQVNEGMRVVSIANKRARGEKARKAALPATDGVVRACTLARVLNFSTFAASLALITLERRVRTFSVTIVLEAMRIFSLP